jgi:hypothetical protein
MTDELFFDAIEKVCETYRPPPGELTEPSKLIIADVSAHRTAENAEKVDALLSKARKEHYHDFLGADFPIIELICDMRQAGMPQSMIEDAENGKYDA